MEEEDELLKDDEDELLKDDELLELIELDEELENEILHKSVYTVGS